MSYLKANRDQVLVQLTGAILQGIASRQTPMSTIVDREHATIAAVNMAVKAYANLVEAVYGDPDEVNARHDT